MSNTKLINFDKIISNPLSIKVLNTSVDMKVLAEYIRFHSKINVDKYFDKDVLLDGDRLLAGKIKSISEQKKILFLMAHTDGLTGYQKLDRFISQASSKIKPWAIICFQEAYSLICEELNDGGTYISSGLGGKGSKIRYYFIISATDNKELEEDDRNLILKCFKLVGKEMNCIIENCKFEKEFGLFKALIPISVAVGNFIDNGIGRCNKKEKILKKDYFVTNMEKPDSQFINNYLKSIK